MDQELLDYFDSSPFYSGSNNEDPKDRADFISSYYLLPETIKSFLTSTSTADSIMAISQKHSLNRNQLILLSVIIRYVVTGSVFIKDLSVLLSKNLGLDPTQASQIANEIISQVFAPVINEIQKIQKEKFQNRGGQESRDPYQKEGAPSLHEQNMGNVVDLRNTKDNG